MFKFFGRRKPDTSNEAKVFQQGREAGNALFSAVEEYLDRRVPEVSERLTDVFRQRLETIHEEPSHPPELAARAEWMIFQEHIEEFPTVLKAQLADPLGEWLAIADELQVRPLVDEYIDRRLNEGRDNLRLASVQMLAATVASLKS